MTSRSRVALRYRPRREYTSRLYGEEPGVFFVLEQSELPWPDDIAELADRLGYDLDAHPLAGKFRSLTTTALVLEGYLEAPASLAELCGERIEWRERDAIDLEREHIAACRRLEGLVTEIRHDLERRLRSKNLPIDTSAPETRPTTTHPDTSAAEPRAPGVVGTSAPERRDAPAVAARLRARVTEAIERARIEELAQRMPTGTRRAIAPLPAGLYLCEATPPIEPTSVKDLEVALRDGPLRARELAVEFVLIDHDGDYPVLVRRFGGDGGTVYRVEEALERHVGARPDGATSSGARPSEVGPSSDA